MDQSSTWTDDTLQNLTIAKPKPISTELSFKIVQSRLRSMRPLAGSSLPLEHKLELRNMVKSMSPTKAHQMIQENLQKKKQSNLQPVQNRRNNVVFKSV